MTATPVSNVPSATLRGSPRKGLAAWSCLDAVLLLAVLAVLGYFAWKAATVFKYKWDWSTIWPFIYRFATATGRWWLRSISLSRFVIARTSQARFPEVVSRPKVWR